MILREETFEKFGYYPDDLGAKSSEKILVSCDKCGVVREIQRKSVYYFRTYPVCRSCAKKGKESWRKGKTKYPQLSDKDWLYAQYWGKGVSQKAIADIVGCCRSTVTYALKRHDINVRTLSEANPLKRKDLRNYDWLFEMYHIKRLSTPEIAKITGCTPNAVISAMREMGVEILKKGKIRIGKKMPESASINLKKTKKERSPYKELWNKDWLFKKYITKHISMRRIGAELGCNAQTVHNHLRWHNIPTRSCGEALPYRQGCSTKQSAPEHIFEDICKKHNLHFKYVGNGDLWIGKGRVLNPDFIEANGQKLIVEIMGSYWHSPLRNQNLPKTALLSYRKKHYKQYKWKPIFIWEEDLLRKDAEEFVLKTLEKEGVI